MNIAQALVEAARQGLPRLDAQLLLLHALGRPQAGRAWLIAHDDDALPDTARQAFAQACARRSAGEPLAYIVGSREFFGMPLQVDRRVLVPRPDTETLVDWALDVLTAVTAPRVIDLGTGSGAIALAIGRARQDADVTATDRSADALAVAAANAHTLGIGLHLRQATWLDGNDDAFDLIVSNPPYVAAGDPHLRDLQHEPLSALASGADGLDDVRVIASQAPGHLRPGGWLLLEHGWDQAGAVRQLLVQAGLARVESRRDLAGIERCTGGQRLELG